MTTKIITTKIFKGKIFEGQNVLITGATGGIGKAIAEEMHNKGANIIISGRNTDQLKKLKNNLGENCEIKECDISKNENILSLMNSIEKLDILICSAGITRDKLSIRMSDNDFTDIIQTNLTSTFIINREAIKKMLRKKYGRIINISSIVGHTGNPGQANYSASKGGVTALTKSLAHEVASKNITLNCIAPGFIVSPMTDILTDEQKQMILNSIPVKRFGHPKEIAKLSSFLASKDAGYITGQTIHINGGMAMI